MMSKLNELFTSKFEVVNANMLKLLFQDAKERNYYDAFASHAPIEFHGLRQPCVGKIDDVLAGIYRDRSEVWHFITEDGALWPAPADDSVAVRTRGTRSLRETVVTSDCA